MEARERTIGGWLEDVSRGIVQLPRFQRGNVWTWRLVEGFLDAILRQRPLGVFLLLEVDPHRQPFKIRPIRGAPNGSERCRQHLLDGQQRLTALWEAFGNLHDTHVFYVTFTEENGVLKEPSALAVSKRGKDRKKIGNPAAEYADRRIPVNVLAPTEAAIAARLEWVSTAIGAADGEAARTSLDLLVEKIRVIISNTHIPFFSLPQETSPDDAIEIFIETNRSSVRLSHYDLAVAQMEEATEESLEEKVGQLVEDVPAIKDLEGRDVGDLVLKVQCLREGRKPTLSNYSKLDFQQINREWGHIVDGVRWSVELLSEIGIWSGDRLPTAVPLRVLPPLKIYVPSSGPELAAATHLIKRYLWAAFLTERYDRDANSRLQEDHDWLQSELKRNSATIDLPKELHVPPDEDALKEAGWPGRRNRLGRAILTACSLDGARDIASNRKLTRNGPIEFHHIFPQAVLKPLGCTADLAMNCMLLHTPTNRHWSDKLPGDFLSQTIEQSVAADSDAESAITERLATHLVPAADLLRIREDNEIDVAMAYKRFVQQRASLARERIESLLKRGEL